MSDQNVVRSELFPGTYVIKKSLRIVKAADSAVLLDWNGLRFWLKSPGLQRYFPALIQRSHSNFTFPELCQEFADELNAAELVNLLTSLRRLKVVDEVRTDTAVPLAASKLGGLIGSFVPDQNQMARLIARLQESTLFIYTRTAIPNDWPSRFSEWKNVQRTTEFRSIGPNELIVALGHVDDRFFWDPLNLQALSSQRPVLCVLIDAFGAFVGPVIGFEGQPCIHCFNLRRNSVVVDLMPQGTQFVKNESNSYAVEMDWPNHFWHQLQAVVENEAIKLATEYTDSETWSGSLIFDFVRQRTRHERLYRVPGCPVCQRARITQ